MAQKVLILLGTKKGPFILEGDALRRSWQLRGPFCETWPINHVIADPATGTIYAGGGNEWFGAAVWKSEDLGATWTHSSEGLAYQEGEQPIKTVWSLAPWGRMPLCRRRAGRPLPKRRWRKVMATRRRPARSPVAAAVAAGRSGADPALAGSTPAGRAADLGRHLRSRSVSYRRWRRHLGAAQPRDQGRLHAGGASATGVRPVRALPGDGAGYARSALPAEPLWHVSER